MSVFSVGALVGYLGLDSAKFDQGILSAQRSLDLTASSALRTGEAVGVTEAQLTGAGRAAGLAAGQSSKYRAAQLSQIAAAERFNTVLADENASLARLAASEAALVRANMRVAASTPVAPLAAAGAAASSSGGLFAAAGSKAAGFAGSMSKLGLGLGVFAAAFEAVSMVKAGAQFQKQMLQLQTLTGATADEVKRMSVALTGLGPQVATGPEALAVSLYHVESVGLRGAKALEVTKVAAMGAKVGMADLEETTNALTSSVASGIKGVENMQQAMGALTTIVGVGDMKMSDLNESLGTGILAVAKEYGVSLSEVGAVLATFGDNNIRGADAATALRMTMMAFAKPAAEGKAALEGIGLTVKSLGKDMEQGGITQAVDDLQSHMKAAGVTGAKVGSFITEAFGKKAGAGLAVLMGQTDRFHNKLDEIAAGSGSFASKWDATTKTTSFAFQKLRAEAEAAGVALFEKVGPGAADAANWLGEKLPAAIRTLQNILGPLEHEVGVGLVVAWKSVTAILSVAEGALSGIGHFLEGHKTVVTGVGTTVLTMWAAWKGYQIVKAAVTAIGSAIETLALKAMYARDGMNAAAVAASGMQIAAGAALAGLGVAAGLAAFAWQKHAAAVAKSKAEVQALTDALKEDNGIIGDNTRLLTANTLQKNGVYEAARKLGLSLDTVTRAALGNAPAIKEVNAAHAAWLATINGTPLALGQTENALAAADRQNRLTTDSTKAANDAWNMVTPAISGQNKKIGEAIQAYKDVAAGAGTAATAQGALGTSVAGTTGAITDGIDPTTVLAKAMGDLGDSATAAGSDFASALSTFASSTGDAKAHADLLGAGLKAMQGDALGFAAAMIGAASANDALTSAFTQQSQTLAQQAASAAQAAQAGAKANTAAQNAADAAARRSQNATGAIAVAEAKLAQVRANRKSTNAQLVSAEHALSVAQNNAATATDSLSQAQSKLAASSSSVATAGSLAYEETERAALNFAKSQKGVLTASIDYSKQGAAPLVQQLQAMQDAAEKASVALYLHEVASKGAGQASKDAADIFKTDTYDALVKDAAQMGVTNEQAQALAKQYFNMPKDFETTAKLLGDGPVLDVLGRIGQQLSFLTGHPWEPKVKAKTKPAEDKLAALKGNLAAIVANGPYVADVVVKVTDAYKKLRGPGSSTYNSQVPEFYGQQYAAGTNDAPGGWSLVGETGPELVNLPPHSKVVPNQQSMQMLAAAEPAKGGTVIEHFEQHNHYPIPEKESVALPTQMRHVGYALGAF